MLIKHYEVGTCLHGQHGQSVQSGVLKPHVHAQCTKHQRHNFKLRKMSLEKIVDEICEISFDFLQDFLSR